MTVTEAIKTRYSVRSYKNEPISREVLDEIIMAASHAPTACNKHPERIFIIESAETLAALDAVRPLFGAPMAAVICYDTEIEWKNKRMGGKGSGETDAAIVTTHMMLAAWERGIGSCWLGAFDGAAVAELLGLDSRLAVSAILTLGYPAEDSEPHPMHFDNSAALGTVSYI